MKKFTFLFITLIAFSTSLLAQTIVSTDPENKNVVLEEFTGIHCGFCPQGHAIAQSIKDAHPDDVVLINIHAGSFAVPSGNEPDYRTPWGAAIDAQANVAGYPAGTVNRHFWPNYAQQGGTAMSRNYWTSASNQILAEPSYLNVGLEATIVTSTRQLVVTVEVYYTGDSPEQTNKLNVAILQDNIIGPQSGGSSSYNHMHMLRHLLTGQWGVEITQTSEGSLYSNTFSYEIPEAYNDVPVVLEDLEIVAFVTETTQEVISGNSAGDITYVVSNDYDAAITQVIVPQIYCSNEVTPKVTLKNYGEVTLNTLEFKYSINGGDEMTYSWAGTLNQLESEEFDLPTYTFEPTDDNTVNIECESPNGEQDELPQNDYYNGFGEGSQNFPENINFGVKIDANPEDVTWNIKNSAGSILAEGGPYSNTGFQISPVTLAETGCYELTLMDASGEGLSGGFYLITDGNNEIIWEGDDFSFEAKADLARGIIVDIHDKISSQDISVYPNPITNNATINFELDNYANVDVELFDILGKKVINIYNGTLMGGSNSIRFNTDEIIPGVYFIKMNIDDQAITKKVLVTK